LADGDADDLVRQNRALNEQVKLLVRTEKRLYSAQRTIEKQLERINQLNRFALASNRHGARTPILQLFLELVLGALRADQAIALVLDEHGHLSVACDRQVDELPPPASSLPRRLFVDLETLRPVVLRGEDGRREGAACALLELVAGYFDGAAPPAPRDPPKAEVIIPFRQRDGRPVGVVVLRTLGELHFNDELPSDNDLSFLELARVHLESALENVSLLQETARKASLEKELEVARTVQESLVPPADVITLGRLSLAGHFEPASVCGGDVWTWKRLGRDRVLLLIGDVTGHGVPSAFIAAVVLGAAELLPAEVTPGEALALLNQAVHRAGKGNLLMSCFVMVMDLASGELAFASAGHPAPFIVHRLGERVSLGSLLGRGSLLGDAAFQPPPVQHARLGPGEILIMFSDGVTECRNPSGQLWGERRLRRAITHAAEASGTPGPSSLDSFRGELARAVADFTGDAECDDDVTFVVAGYA
jgi:serine phosphatase RsbU (regulator of sigma subunit)